MRIAVGSLTKRFGSNLAVDNITTEFRGSVNVLLGANGSGKSTLINILAGLTYPNEGHVVLDGEPISVKDRRRLREEIERLRSNAGFLLSGGGYPSNLTGLEFLHSIGGKDADDGWVSEILDDLQMSDYIEKKIGEYSTGMTQKLGIAASLSSKPEVVLWDEPTANLDARSRRSVVNLAARVSQQGSRFIIASHTPSDFDEVADWVGFMQLGRLIKAGDLSLMTNGARWEVHTDKPSEVAASLIMAGFATDVRITHETVSLKVSEGFDPQKIPTLDALKRTKISSVVRVQGTLSEVYAAFMVQNERIQSAKMGEGLRT
ncbi:MAG: ABC transporter ATP-binding protein [Nitrososphaerota archaeon]|nr:ABC transporter ATP-binding protein [Nitrososphaerota archaeon]